MRNLKEGEINKSARWRSILWQAKEKCAGFARDERIAAKEMSLNSKKAMELIDRAPKALWSCKFNYVELTGFRIVSPKRKMDSGLWVTNCKGPELLGLMTLRSAYYVTVPTRSEAAERQKYHFLRTQLLIPAVSFLTPAVSYRELIFCLKQEKPK